MTVEGIDVSKWQGRVDWRKVAAAGKAFAFVRVADGTKHLDERHGENAQGAREAGLLVGSYLFFRCGEDAAVDAQVAILCSQHRDGDLLPVLDVEAKSENGEPLEIVRGQVRRAIEEVTRIAGGVMVYTAASWWDRWMRWSPDAPLWVAHYGAERPRLPAPWLDRGWSFWQYSGSGECPGVTGACDLNRWHGSLEELRAFAQRRC